MSVVAIIVSLICMFCVGLIARFFYFRRKLFSALVDLGITKEIADVIYTEKREIINKLNLEKGLTPAQIARLIIENKI